MIDEVVKSILEAEDAAKEKIASAKTEASKTIAYAEAEADKFKKQSSAENKVYFAKQSKQSDSDATAYAQKLLAELNAKTDEETASYEKNVDAAVKIILESF